MFQNIFTTNTPSLPIPRNFTVAAAADYWVDVVIGELATDQALTTGRGAVFFDEGVDFHVPFAMFLI